MKTEASAVGYVRCSTTMQATEGVTLANQRERIEAYCQFKGLALAEIVEDAGLSGGVNRDRPGFLHLLDIIETGRVKVLVLYSLERLSRDMLTLLALERLLDEHDVELHTVEGLIDTSTFDGWMSFAMKAFLGEVERRQIKHRTRKAMQFKRSRGEVVGAVPWGYRRNGATLEPVPEEQDAIARVNEKYQAGDRLTDIVRWMNETGIPTRAGTPWTAAQARKLIRDYAGSFKKSVSRMGTATRQFIEAVA